MPSPDQYTFDSGVDYTLQFGGYASALLQGIQLMTPNSQHGIVAYMESQPQTTGQPSGYPTNWYTFNARSLWVKPSTGETFSYVTGLGYKNVASLIPTNTITGAMVKTNTINLSNLYVPVGTTVGFVPTVNSGGSLSFSDPVNGRVDGSITVSKLTPGANNQFLRTVGGIVQWDTFDGTDINALLAITKLQPTYIAPGGPKQIMATDPTANYSNWYDFSDLIDDGTIPVAKLSGGTSTTGQSIRRNSSNNGWEYYTPAGSSPVTLKWVSALQTVADHTVAHTPDITGIPSMWKAVMVCNTAENNYVVGQEVDLASFVYDDGGSATGVMITVTVDATNFIIKKCTTGGAQLYTLDQSTGARVACNLANWRIKIYALN